MKTKHHHMAIALRVALTTAALGGSIHAQTFDATNGITLGNLGKITNAPVITTPTSVTSGVGFSWEFTPALQGLMVPAGQFTGLTTSNTAVSFEDLIPIKSSKISIVTGAAGAAPTGTGTIIDGNGIETNAFSLLDTSTNNPADVTIVNGVLYINGVPVGGSGSSSGIIPVPGEPIYSGAFTVYYGSADIPAGTLGTLAGNSANIPISAFKIDKTEVTYGHYRLVYNWAMNNSYVFAPLTETFSNNNDNLLMPANRYAGGGAGPDHPVQSVNWYDAVLWCNARSEMEGLTPAYYITSTYNDANVYRNGNGTNVVVDSSASGYRLPTEAEWEWAARGGSTAAGIHPWGTTSINHSMAAYDSYSGSTTVPVGSFSASKNPYGLDDMAGNVWEWCFEVVPGVPTLRLTRGGGWSATSSGLTVEYRNGDFPVSRAAHVGFRTVRNN